MKSLKIFVSRIFRASQPCFMTMTRNEFKPLWSHMQLIWTHTQLEDKPSLCLGFLSPPIFSHGSLARRRSLARHHVNSFPLSPAMLSARCLRPSQLLRVQPPPGNHKEQWRVCTSGGPKCCGIETRPARDGSHSMTLTLGGAFELLVAL